MLLTPIGTRENADPSVCEASIGVGVDIFHTFIDKIQIDLMVGVKGRAGEAVDSLSAGV